MARRRCSGPQGRCCRESAGECLLKTAILDLASRIASGGFLDFSQKTLASGSRIAVESGLGRHSGVNRIFRENARRCLPSLSVAFEGQNEARLEGERRGPFWEVV